MSAPAPSMKRRLEILAAVVGIVTGLSGYVGAFIFLPMRVAAVEKRMDTVEAEHQKDHDTLTRIEERIDIMQDYLGITNKTRERNRTQ